MATHESVMATGEKDIEGATWSSRVAIWGFPWSVSTGTQNLQMFRMAQRKELSKNTFSGASHHSFALDSCLILVTDYLTKNKHCKSKKFVFFIRPISVEN